MLIARVVNLGLVLIPFAGLVVGIVLLWGVVLSWPHLAVFGGMFLLTALGITVGYHRYFTHRSFKTFRPIAVLLAFLGSMAVEGSLLTWVADHRRHHQHSDEEGDPHSPRTHRSGIWGMLKGLWHAHMGWLFSEPPANRDRYTGDLRKSRSVRWMSRLFPLWVIVGLAIPAVLGGLLTMSWFGVLLGFIWGGLVRVFFVHHVTWSVNSICHLWGTRPFKTKDDSCNNPIFGVLALGEGWHNNHHAFPTSARHGLRWWEVDASYAVIWAMSKVGLAWDVRIPSPAQMAAKHR
ncbi:MAG: acyl-CoA desaturase [Phycisphaerae bacterium]|nr:acyl-CoA desaturase [Phycisphaerae bacterium]